MAQDPEKEKLYEQGKVLWRELREELEGTVLHIENEIKLKNDFRRLVANEQKFYVDRSKEPD